ncbi:penicillin-binding protein [Candidatus Woesearchaeota archaeon]|nr:penicillin-binding protein [Candidatus Woesearchaeota archaeon]
MGLSKKVREYWNNHTVREIEEDTLEYARNIPKKVKNVLKDPLLKETAKSMLHTAKIWTTGIAAVLVTFFGANSQMHFIEKGIAKALERYDKQGIFYETGYLWQKIDFQKNLEELISTGEIKEEQPMQVTSTPRPFDDVGDFFKFWNNEYRDYRNLASIVYHTVKDNLTIAHHLEGVFPSIQALDEFPKNDSENIVFNDRKGRQLAMIRSNHKYYTLDEISNTLETALIIQEDERFRKHAGFDFMSAVRAYFVNKKAGRIVEGASTLTMQIAKHLFVRNGANYDKTYERKIKEIMLAMQIDYTHSKDFQLEFYMNNICEFGNGVVGFGDASLFYFNKRVADISLAEATFLAVIPNNPAMHPYRADGLKLIMQNQARLLEEMVDEKEITQEQADQVKATVFNFSKPNSRIKTPFPYVIDFVNSYFQLALEDLGLPADEFDLTNPNGLFRMTGTAEFNTTLDRNLMWILNNAVFERRFHWSQDYAFMITNANSGEIRAICSSDEIGQNANMLKNYDYPTGSSLLKPLTYALALQSGEMDVGSRFDDTKVAPIIEVDGIQKASFTITDTSSWNISNYNKKFHGEQLWTDLVKTSNNIVPAKLVLEMNNGQMTGAEMLKWYLGLLGTDLSRYTKSGDEIYSSVLGTIEQTVFEANSGFRVFHDGKLIRNAEDEPSLILRNFTLQDHKFEVEDNIDYEGVLADNVLPYIQAALWKSLNGSVGGLSRYYAYGKTGTSEFERFENTHGRLTNATWYNLVIKSKYYGDLVFTGVATTHKKTGYIAAKVHGPIVKNLVKKLGKTDSKGHFRNLNNIIAASTKEPETEEVSKFVISDMSVLINNYVAMNGPMINKSGESHFIKGDKIYIKDNAYEVLADLSTRLNAKSRKKYLKALNQLRKGVYTRNIPLVIDINDIIGTMESAKRQEHTYINSLEIGTVISHLRKEF